MKLKYLIILFGVFYSAFIITAPTKNKSKRNTRTRSTSKRRPTQRKTISRGRTSSRGMSRGGGSSAPSSSVGATPTKQKPAPLNITFFDQKIITLNNAGKESIKQTKEKLQEIKNKLQKEKAELIKLQKSLESKPKTITNKEIIKKEENYRKKLDEKKPQTQELVAF